jgi:C4-dicarboxylate transporter DctQ subunit
LHYVFDTVRVLGAVSPVLEVPKWLVYLAVPIGFFLAGIQYALACVRTLTTGERYVSFDHRDGYDDEPSAL